MDNRIKVSYGGEEHEYLMSYALLTKIVRLVGEDMAIQDADAMVETTKAILGVKELPEDLSLEDGEALTQWASGHVLDFFIRKAKNLGPKLNQMQKVQSDLLSLSGSTE